MSDHSPLPWRIGYDKISETDGIFDADNIYVGDTDDAADRLLIVTAVNSHKELLAAAKDVAEPCNRNYGEGYVQELWGRLEAAIARAEGQT